MNCRICLSNIYFQRWKLEIGKIPCISNIRVNGFLFTSSNSDPRIHLQLFFWSSQPSYCCHLTKILDHQLHSVSTPMGELRHILWCILLWQQISVLTCSSYFILSSVPTGKLCHILMRSSIICILIRVSSSGIIHFKHPSSRTNTAPTMILSVPRRLGLVPSCYVRGGIIPSCSAPTSDAHVLVLGPWF